jgi:hypothetical protein
MAALGSDEVTDWVQVDIFDRHSDKAGLIDRVV